MNRAWLWAIAFYAMSFALFGCGSGGGAQMAAPPTSVTTLEAFVRDVMADDPGATPREINGVTFTTEVRDGTFDDAFPT